MEVRVQQKNIDSLFCNRRPRLTTWEKNLHTGDNVE